MLRIDSTGLNVFQRYKQQRVEKQNKAQTNPFAMNVKGDTLTFMGKIAGSSVFDVKKTPAFQGVRKMAAAAYASTMQGLRSMGSKISNAWKWMNSIEILPGKGIIERINDLRHENTIGGLMKRPVGELRDLMSNAVDQRSARVLA